MTEYNDYIPTEELRRRFKPKYRKPESEATKAKRSESAKKGWANRENRSTVNTAPIVNASRQPDGRVW